MEGSVVIQEGVAANITLGNGLSTTHEDSRDFSCGGFIVNGSVEMDIDIYDGTVNLFEEEDDEQTDRRSDASDVDSDVELVTVLPKSKSRLLPPLPPSCDDGDSDVEVVSESAESETQISLHSKSGYVKELIEYNGLGIIFSMESGPVLFSTSHVWIEGKLVDHEVAYRHIRTGSVVEFIEYVVESPEYNVLSPDCVIRQALFVWVGPKPSHFWRMATNKEHLAELENNRKEFVNRIKSEDFLPLDLVRSGGKIAGYLNDDIGIITTRDTYSGQQTYVFFHTTDAFLYREALVLDDENFLDALPVGLSVRFDALSVKTNCREVTHQACAVFAGAWPAVPHPTLLPGGQETFSPCYNIPANHTFYYLQLSLNENMQLKLRNFERFYFYCHGPLSNSFLKVGPVIENFEDYVTWKHCYAPTKFLQNHDSRGRNNQRKSAKRNYHVFSKEPPTRSLLESIPYKIKKELKTENGSTIKRESGQDHLDVVVKKERL